MEIANRFGNNEFDSDNPDDSSSPEKNKKKERRGTEKKPIVLEGILFDRSKDLKESEPSKPEPKQSETSEAEPVATKSDQAAEVLAAEREVTEEIVETRQEEVAAEIAAESPGSEATVAEADEDLLQQIRSRIDTAQAEGPANTEAVTETIDVAYQQTAEQIANTPIKPIQEAEPTPEQPVETVSTAPDVIDAALKSMNEAYEHYQAPDYTYHTPELAPEADRPAALPPQLPVERLIESRPNNYGTATKNQVLGAGIFGYLLGRWRGRKRAERRFAPIKHDLEQTVTELQGAVGNREAQIRDLQREQLRQQPLTAYAEKPAAPVVPEKSPLPPTSVVGETMTMPLPAAPEAARQEIVEHAPRAEQLTPTQLLQVAEAIKVDGVTVRSMFEVRRFDETSLRRIVNEYLRRGEVSRVVAEEIERHDRFRYARFETLNQAAPGPMIASMPTTDSHDSLPRPVLPAANTALMKTRHAAPSHTMSPQPTASGTQMSVTGPTVTERLMIALSLLFVGIALVLLVAIITSRS